MEVSLLSIIVVVWVLKATCRFFFLMHLDNIQQKEYTGHYILYNMAETWLGLLEFTGHTYQEWKMAVMQLYPGTDEMACYTLSNLKQLTTQTFNSSLATLGQFLDYYHDFQQMVC